MHAAASPASLAGCRCSSRSRRGSVVVRWAQARRLIDTQGVHKSSFKHTCNKPLWVKSISIRYVASSVLGKGRGRADLNNGIKSNQGIGIGVQTSLGGG